MEIKILNFGPIKKFEFGLSKDLIMIYGKNNIGKSYAMEVVYLILKNLLNIDRFRLLEITRKEVEKKKHIVEEQIGKGKEFDLTKDVNGIIKDILNNAIIETLENSFKNTFGELRRLQNNQSKQSPVIQFTISGQMIHLAIKEEIQVKEFMLNKEVVGKYSEEKAGYLSEKERYILNFSDPVDKSEMLLMFIDDMIRKMTEEVSLETGDIYFFPASRTGLYSAFQMFIPLLAGLSKMRANIKGKIELPNWSEPIADYIILLSELNGQLPGKNKYLDIAARIEKNILKGEVGFDPIRKELTYRLNDSELVLEMHYVSSMVSELAPIVAFLKYILGKSSKDTGIKPVIFIEEPEAHLHPEAQVQLVEIFVKLAKAHVKLIITSHSNYMFNKLNNMTLEKTLDLSMYSPIILKDTGKGTVGKSMATDDSFVEDENFMDTTNALYEERENILERLNKEHDDR